MPSHGPFPVGVSVSAAADLPLGRAEWANGVYFDFSDPAYDAAEPGSPLAFDLVPAAGAGSLTREGAPTVQGADAFGNRTIRTTATGPALLELNWLASVMSGTDVPGTHFFSIRIESSGSRIICGAGDSTHTTSQFWEVATSSTNGTLTTRKNDNAGTLQQVTAGNTGFVDVRFAVVNTGTQATIYKRIAGVTTLQGSTGTIDIGALSVNRFKLGCGARQTNSSVHDMRWDKFAFLPRAATVAELDAVFAFWEAKDPPAFAGPLVYLLGDSLTRGSDSTNQNGYRIHLYNARVANGWNFRQAGSLNTGTFPDNRHSGYASTKVASHVGIAATGSSPELGAGRPFASTRLVIWLGGTNDANDPGGGDPVGTGLANYSAGLTAIHNQLVTGDPTARICVCTIPDSNGWLTQVNAWNSGLVSIWNAFDSAHPSATLFRADPFTALGLWSSTYFASQSHPNDAGYVILANAIMAAQTAGGTTLTSFLASF